MKSKTENTDSRSHYEVNVRKTMRSIPNSMQWLLTWVTGKPLNVEEKELCIPIWLDVVITPTIGIASIYGLIKLSDTTTPLSYLGIIALWCILVGQLRKIQVTHIHHSIHNRLFNNPILNKIYALILPSLIFTQNSNDYKHEHLRHHNARIFTTREDSDAAFLAQLGFLPGRTKSELKTNLWMTIFSPVFHILFTKIRLSSTLIKGSLESRLLTSLTLTGYFLLLLIIGLKSFIIAIIIPIFFLYHISALLQFLTEHAWNITSDPTNDWGEYQERCWGRFCGEAFPYQKNRPPFRLRQISESITWSLRMFFIHLPTRISCLVADLPAHDWHHLAHRIGQNPGDWSRSLYLREKAIANGDKVGFSQREIWGINNMIDHQFNFLQNIKCTYESRNINPMTPVPLFQKE